MTKRNLKEILKNALTEKEIANLNKSFEIVGDIAIIEIPKELEEKEKEIGEGIIKINSHIKTVLKKSGIHHGVYRTQDLIHIAGENKKETIYIENNTRLKINPETVYFSAKLSTERANLASQIKENQTILVMFSGVGPYTFTMLKKQPNIQNITSIEINPEANKYAKENLELNKNIVKKSTIYKNSLTFLRENKLKVNEKELATTIANLKLSFIEGDVKIQTENLLPKEYFEEINEYDNNLIYSSPKDTYINLSKLEKKDLILDLNTLKNTFNLPTLLALFSNKFNYICKIKNKTYIFDTSISKNHLIKSLETNTPIPKYYKYDEIFMPLPKEAETFLDCALKLANKDCIIHLYNFVHENDFPHQIEKIISDIAEIEDKKIEIISTRKVGQYSPEKYRVCCDFKVLN